MNNNNVFSKKSIKNKTQMEETPYWDNTNELVGGLIEEEDEGKDEKGKPLQGLALLKKIYGSKQEEPKGGKRTAKEIKKFIEASYNEKNPPAQIEGFLLDTELSNKTAKVYHNPTTGETVIAHRGTQGITDWGNNLAYVTGNYEKTDRYKKGKKNQKKAEAKYGAENISTLGHSQGAIIARKTGANTKEIIGVNPASLGEKPLDNEYNVRTSGDLVSKMLPSGKNVTTIKSKTSNPLTEHSAKNLKQIKNQQIGAGIKILYNDMNNHRRRRALNYSANDIDWVNDGLLDEDDEMFGGDIFKDISKGAKSLGKKISKGSKKVGKDISDVAKKGYKTINKTALKQDWGGYIETVKEPLLEVLEPAMSAAMESAGVPAPVADTISASAVGSAKAVNFGKSLKGQGQKALTGAIHGAITGAVGSMTGGDPEEGAGLRRGRKMKGGMKKGENEESKEEDELAESKEDEPEPEYIQPPRTPKTLKQLKDILKGYYRELKGFYNQNKSKLTPDTKHHIENWEIPCSELLEEIQDPENQNDIANDGEYTLRLTDRAEELISYYNVAFNRIMGDFHEQSMKENTELMKRQGKGRASQIVSAIEAKKMINLQKMKNPSQWLINKYGKKKYVRPQRGVKGARGKRGAQKTAKMTEEEKKASRKATLAKSRAKTIALSSEIKDVVKAIPTMNYLELIELKPTLIRFNNAERTKAEDNNLEKLKKAFNKRSEELKESNKGRRQGMALARARDTSNDDDDDDDDVIEGFGRKGKGRASQIVSAIEAKKMINLQKMKNPSQWLINKYGKKKYVRPQKADQEAMEAEDIDLSKMTMNEFAEWINKKLGQSFWSGIKDPLGNWFAYKASPYAQTLLVRQNGEMLNFSRDEYDLTKEEDKLYKVIFNRIVKDLNNGANPDDFTSNSKLFKFIQDTFKSKAMKTGGVHTA